MLSPRGMTALYDASVEAVEAVGSYGRSLMLKDFDANGIVFIITDGADNESRNSIAADTVFNCEERVYSLKEGRLSELSILQMGQHIQVWILLSKNVMKYASKIFDDILIEDVLGKIHVVIPYRSQCFAEMEIQELTGRQIVGAKYQNGMAMFVIGENGSYRKIIVKFNAQFTEYKVVNEAISDTPDINFCVTARGVAVMVQGEEITMTNSNYDNDGTKTVNDDDLKLSGGLMAVESNVYCLDNRKVLKVNLV